MTTNPENKVEIAGRLDTSFNQASIILGGGGCCSTILARDYKDPKLIAVRHDENKH